MNALVVLNIMLMMNHKRKDKEKLIKEKYMIAWKISSKKTTHSSNFQLLVRRELLYQPSSNMKPTFPKDIISGILSGKTLIIC